MPEIAEAHTMANQISILSGHKIINIDIYSSDNKKFTNLFSAKGKKVIRVFAIGKHPIIQLEDGFIYSTLSMTGKWLLPCEHLNKHIDYVKLRISYGSVSERINRIKGYIYFMDSRTWGSVKHLSGEEYDNEISKLGPDPLNRELTQEIWRSVIAKKNTSKRKICDFLKDQAIISGIGNYCRVEIMYDAKINPFKPISTLTDEEINKLYNSIIKIVNLAYQHSGFSISDTVGNYVTPQGKKGTCPMAVYKQPFCPNDHPVVKYKANSSAQTIHYCSQEQIS